MKKVIAVACTVLVAGIECGAPLSVLAQERGAGTTTQVRQNSSSPAVVNPNPNSQLGNFFPDKSKGGETVSYTHLDIKASASNLAAFNGL